jgi:hypothetical protein
MSHARSAAVHFANALRVLSVPETRGDAMDAVLARLASDSEQHLEGPPATEEEIERLESALGRRLPSEARRLLIRFGGSVLYEGHEIFGAQPLFIHDIVMVPDILTIRAALRRGRPLPVELVPFHRADGVTHFLDLSHATDSTAPVVSLDGAERFASVAEFLAMVVTPQFAGR